VPVPIVEPLPVRLLAVLPDPVPLPDVPEPFPVLPVPQPTLNIANVASVIKIFFMCISLRISYKSYCDRRYTKFTQTLAEALQNHRVLFKNFNVKY
jgi:hypothetical protein